MHTTGETCLTCYGTGETVVDAAPETCPDCFGEGRPVGRGTKLEWRLRALETAYRNSERETASDVLWLVNELRDARAALVRIFARCQDASETDDLAREIGTEANKALGLHPVDAADADDAS